MALLEVKQWIQNGIELGKIKFGSDGNDFNNYLAEIRSNVDGTRGSDDILGSFGIDTTADGSSSPTERMRITKYGEVLIGKTTTSLTDDGLRL